MTHQNPYKFMQLTFNPDRVYGWEREIPAILQVVTAAEPTSYAIYGIRAIGKSTLLKFLKHKRGATVRYRDYVGRDYRPDMGGYRKLLWVYINFHELTGDTNIFNFMYAHLYDELDAQGITDEFTLDTPTHDLDKTDAAIRLRKILKRLDAQQEIRVVFLLDDFDLPLSSGQINEVDDRQLRSVSFEASLVIATDDPISEIKQEFKEDSPLLGILRPEPIGLISFAAAYQLIREPAAHADPPVHFTDAEVELLLEVGGRQPYLLTAVCEEYFDMRSDIGDLERIYDDPNAYQQLRSTLMNRLIVRPHVKSILNLMWTRRNEDSEQPLLVHMAMNEQQPISGAGAAALAAKSLAYPVADGYRIFSPLFAKFVRERAINPEAIPASPLPPTMNGILETLTPIDRAVFEYLYARIGQTCTFEELLVNVWNDHEGTTKRAVEASVHRLRRAVPPQHEIKNVRGKGYKYIISDAARV